MASPFAASARFLSLLVVAMLLTGCATPSSRTYASAVPAIQEVAPAASGDASPELDEAVVTACAAAMTLPRSGAITNGLFALTPPTEGRMKPEAPKVETAGDDDAWKVSLTTFLWVSGMAGDVEINGTETSFDNDPLETLEALLDNFDFAGSALLAVRHGPWSVEVTGIYVGLGNETSRGPIDVEFDLDQVIFQVVGGYRFAHWALDREAGLEGPTLSLEALVGARYFGLGVEIDLDPGPKVDKDKHWVDPLIGTRVTLAATDSLSFAVQGMIGGFGVGTDFTWQLRAGLEWALSEGASLVAGYAWMDVDYDDDDFEFDVLLYGPYLGGVFRF